MRNVSDLVVHAGVLVLMSPNLKDAYFSVGLWCHEHLVTSLFVLYSKNFDFPFI